MNEYWRVTIPVIICLWTTVLIPLIVNKTQINKCVFQAYLTVCMIVYSNQPNQDQKFKCSEISFIHDWRRNSSWSSERQDGSDAVVDNTEEKTVMRRFSQKRFAKFVKKESSSNLFPACMRSKASLILSKGKVWVTNSSTISFLFM